MKKVLVTGANGFIGSHLVEFLLSENFDTVALCEYNSFGDYGWLSDHQHSDGLRLVLGDVRDDAQVRALVKDVDCVFNLAALIAIPYSYQAPSSYIQTNVIGCLNILNAVRDYGADLIQVSTSEVYGTAKYVPIDESHGLSAQSPYAASKIASDQLALSYFSSFGSRVKIVRPFNTYGPRQSMRAVIPSIIMQLLAGDELRLGALSPTRDFTFVSDTVRGLYASLLSESGFGEVTNLGAGFEIAIGDLVSELGVIMKKDVRLQKDEARTRPPLSEVERLWSDNRRAKERFGWSPEYAGISGLREGLVKTVEWFSIESNRSRYPLNPFHV